MRASENAGNSEGSEGRLLEGPPPPVKLNIGDFFKDIFDPKSSNHRFAFLVFICTLQFGSYFCYDNPGALQDKFVRNFNLTNSQFAALYSWYSWPNSVLCLGGGFLIDSVFGVRLAAIIFCLISLFGQILFAIGGFLNSFHLMVFGRFVLGAGGESLAIAQTAYAVKWFRGKELSMVYGLQISLSRVGETLNFNTMIPLYNWISSTSLSNSGTSRVGILLLIASCSCILSLAGAIALALLDYRAGKANPNTEQDKTDGQSNVTIFHVRNFPLTFWLLCSACCIYYNAIFPFIALGQGFFETFFGLPVAKANALNSVLYVVSGLSAPFFGLLVDRTGRNISYGCLCIVGTMGAHALLAFAAPFNPTVGMGLMGLCFSLLSAAMWPTASIAVRKEEIGTAFGIMQAFWNLNQGVIVWVAGKVVDSGGYLMMELLMLGVLGVSLLLMILLWIFDRDGRFNMTAANQQILLYQTHVDEEDEYN